MRRRGGSGGCGHRRTRSSIAPTDWRLRRARSRGRDVADLLLAQLVAERGHPPPPFVTCAITAARSVTFDRSGPPLPPRPRAPWRARTVGGEHGLAGRGVPAAAPCRLRHRARCRHPLPEPEPGRSCRRARRARGSSPCGVAWRLLPWARKATYCFPSCSKNDAVLFAPAPVWKFQSRSPWCASYASSSPLLRPTKTRLPFVVLVPA